MSTVWLAWQRGMFYGEADPPGPSTLVAVCVSREAALQRCWPEGDSRMIEEVDVVE